MYFQSKVVIFKKIKIVFYALYNPEKLHKLIFAEFYYIAELSIPLKSNIRI